VNINRVIGGIAGLLLLAACGMDVDDTPTSKQGQLSGKVSGTVTYRERIALPPDAVVEVKLLDVSRMDVAATTIAEQTIKPSHQVPIPFELVYDTALIDARMEYSVQATIKRGVNFLFVTDRRYAVLTRGNAESADLILVRSGGGRAPVADASFTNTRWELKTLNGESIRLEPNQKAPFLQFNNGNKTVAGFAGCNNFTGGYTVAGASLEFDNLASTMMACRFMSLEDNFQGVLQAVERYDIRGTWLILFGADGELATLEAWYE